MHNDRLAFRPSPADLANLARIADGVRRQGRPFANRTDCLRLALELATARFDSPDPSPASHAPRS